jgi:hypothetical protein
MAQRVVINISANRRSLLSRQAARGYFAEANNTPTACYLSKMRPAWLLDQTEIGCRRFPFQPDQQHALLSASDFADFCQYIPRALSACHRVVM